MYIPLPYQHYHQSNQSSISESYRLMAEECITFIRKQPNRYAAIAHPKLFREKVDLLIKKSEIESSVIHVNEILNALNNGQVDSSIYNKAKIEGILIPQVLDSTSINQLKETLLKKKEATKKKFYPLVARIKDLTEHFKSISTPASSQDSHRDLIHSMLLLHKELIKTIWANTFNN